MKLYTAEQMREIDEHAIGTVGVAAAALMETAGRAVAARVLSMMGSGPSKRVLVLVGKGNNGGDGLVAARVLHDAGVEVHIVLSSEPQSTEGPAASNLQAVRGMGIDVSVYLSGSEASSPEWQRPDLCIDALLGVGSTGAPRGALKEMVEAANRLPCPRLSVDIPTGLDATTGIVEGKCIHASATVTFGCGKVGLFADPGVRYCGSVEIVDIGFPRASVVRIEATTRAIDAEMVRDWLPDRPRFGNKGTFGNVAVIAGSSGMMGAAVLCSRAALRVGAGLVRLAAGQESLIAVNSMTPEVICRPVPYSAGVFGPDSLDALRSLTEGARAVAIGPGISSRSETAELIAALLPHIEAPMVIDADALNILSGDPSVLRRLKAPAILTPHPGEMSRLAGPPVEKVQAERIRHAREFAREWGVIVVLKGAATVVASPEGEVLINTTGNAGMATAGTGDVLTGTITGLIAQGMSPFEAAGCGVYLHGAAGDHCAKRSGEVGIMASDLVEAIPHAQARVRGGSKAL